MDRWSAYYSYDKYKPIFKNGVLHEFWKSKRNTLNLATKGLWNLACFLLHFYSSWQWTDEICKIIHMSYLKPWFITFHHFVNFEFSSISDLSGKFLSFHLQKWAASGIIPLRVSHRVGRQIMCFFSAAHTDPWQRIGVVSTLVLPLQAHSSDCKIC